LERFVDLVEAHQVDILPDFATEVIESVLDYGADKKTAWGSIEEYIRDTVEVYYPNEGLDKDTFRRHITTLCRSVHDGLKRSKAYDNTGALEATFLRYLGYNVVLRKMTADELNAVKPPYRDRGP
jgi:hypothetical protein